MVEKFAASGINGPEALDLYRAAGACLEKKGYHDTGLVDSLKGGNFGFRSPRPLLWLWRFSSRQKKVSITEVSSNSGGEAIDWSRIFGDTSKPLVADVGCGMGTSLLNLSSLRNGRNSISDSSGGGLQMAWSDFNYAGADLNRALVRFGNGIVSRDTASQRKGRVHFFALSAEDFLISLKSYPGELALIMINFPSPYRLGDTSGGGNTQLPSASNFMVTKQILELIAELLSKSSGRGKFLFQTKCEDVVVHVQTKCLSLGTLECIHSTSPMEDVDLQYEKLGKRPKRVDEWLKVDPFAERAEGYSYWAEPLLPTGCQPETEVQCSLENILVHRCLFHCK